MKLTPVRGNRDATSVLYALLAERPRENWISHEAMPTRGQHEKFVESNPFAHWYLIALPTVNAETMGVGGCVYVGALEVTDRNEIGIAIFERYKRKGYAFEALSIFLRTHKPLPPIPAVRNGRWLANIAMNNDVSKDFFYRMGFSPLQETWVLNG